MIGRPVPAITLPIDSRRLRSHDASHWQRLFSWNYRCDYKACAYSDQDRSDEQERRCLQKDQPDANSNECGSTNYPRAPVTAFFHCGIPHVSTASLPMWLSTSVCAPITAIFPGPSQNLITWRAPVVRTIRNTT